MKEIFNFLFIFPADISLLVSADTRRRKILDFMLAAISAMTLALLVIIFVISIFLPGQIHNADLTAIYTGALIGLAAFITVGIINHRVSTRTAGILFLLATYIAIISADTPQEIVNGRSLIFMTLPVIIAAILFPPRGGILVALINGAAISHITVFYKLGLPNLPAILALFFIALLVWRSTSILEHTLEQLQASNHSLLAAQEHVRQVNAELEQRVAERTVEFQTALAQLRTEMTERKQAEEARRQAEANLEEAQRISQLGSWDWNLTTGRLQFSDEMFRLAGMLPGAMEITRETFTQFLHPEEAEQVLWEFQHGAVQPFTDIEHRIVRADGEMRNAHTRIKAYLDENGKPLRLLGSTQDITDRKRTAEALHVAEADYRAIFEKAPVGIFRSTVEGRYLKVNQTIAALYGYRSPTEMINAVESIATQVYAAPSSRGEFMRLLALQGEVQGFITHRRRRDGSTFWVSVNARAVKNGTDKVLYYEGFVEDITRRKQSEIALQEANEQLRIRLNKITELQSTLHEQAVRDELTGLYNRRYMHESLTRECARALREGYPVSIIVLDLDHLKEVNEKYGHFSGGDIALRALGKHLKSMIRAEDIACRYGGDEFMITLHNTPAQSAYERAEQWRKALVKTNIEGGDTVFNITFSAGVATFNSNRRNIEEVMRAADKALYRAKSLGRNRVELDPE